MTAAAPPPVRQRVAIVATSVLASLALLPAAVLGAPADQSESVDRAESQDAGRPADRPPTHATSDAPEGRPPAHATSDAPEDRPPAHARARRASVKEDQAEQPQGGAARPDAPPARAPGEAAGEPGPTRPVPPDPAPGRPARDTPPGRASDRPAAAPDPGTELDTDTVVSGPRPLPERAPTSVEGSRLPASGSPIVIAAAAPPPSSGGGFTSPGGRGTLPVPPAPSGAADVASPDRADDVLAAPRPRPVDPPTVPELTRRVVVPVAVLVAGLVYLLAQGRIDRRGVLLAPETTGDEHDDDVFEL